VDSVPASTVDLLNALGIDIDKTHRRCPSVLRYDPTRITAIVSCLNIHGLDVLKVVNRQPIVLQVSPGKIASNMEFLRTLPIDAKKAVESSPGLLFCSIVTLRSKIDLLVSLGLKPHLVITRFPSISTHSKKSIHLCFEFLSHLGLDAVRILNSVPSVIGHDLERTLRPTIEFITTDMGRSLQEINACPRCLTCSLKQRLTPRYRYMMLYGKRKDYSLSTLCCYPNHRFAMAIGTHSLQQYEEWLQCQRRC